MLLTQLVASRVRQWRALLSGGRVTEALSAPPHCTAHCSSDAPSARRDTALCMSGTSLSLVRSALLSSLPHTARRGAARCTVGRMSSQLEWSGMEWNGRVERCRKQSSLRAANARDCVASCGFIRVGQQLTCSAYSPHRTYYTVLRGILEYLPGHGQAGCGK